MNDKNNKKKRIFLIFGVIFLVLIVIGAAYAYFVAQIGSGAKSNVNIQAGTTDSLQFKTGGPISIEATMENFAEGKGNRSDSTTATATAIAGSDRIYSDKYNLFLVIESNDFQYTTDAKTPELVLKVTGPNNEEVKEIDGLSYNETAGGFDITTTEDTIAIAKNHEIETNSTKIDNWNIEVILVNLNSDQNANTGKSFDAKLYLTQEALDEYVKPQVNTISISTFGTIADANLGITTTIGTANISKYYYAYQELSDDGSVAPLNDLEYIENTTNVISVTGLKENTKYKFYVYVEDENGYSSNKYEEVIETLSNDDYMMFMMLPTIYEVNLNYSTNSINVVSSIESSYYFTIEYYYSIDGGDYIKGTSNTYTFTDVDITKKHTIKMYVKFIDSSYPTITSPVYIKTSDYQSSSIESFDVLSTTGRGITVQTGYKRGSNAASKYYYSVNGGSAIESTNAVQNFTDLNSNSEYEIKVYAEDTTGQRTNEMSLKASTVNSITDVCSSGDLLTECIKKAHKEDGYNGIYYHDGNGTYTNSDQEDGSNSYRFTGTNPENYICFGASSYNGNICLEGSVYRIIGLFDYQNNGTYQTKLIRNIAYGQTYYWGGAANQVAIPWGTSTLNTSTLNSGFYNSFNKTYSPFIELTSWKPMLNVVPNTVTAKIAFDSMVVGEATSNKVQRYIGLMDVADYMYAANPTYWTTIAYDLNTPDYRRAVNENWMYTGITEWAIQQGDNFSDWGVNNQGAIAKTNYTAQYSIRPVFNISSSVVYESGSGTFNDPIRIKVDE